MPNTTLHRTVIYNKLLLFVPVAGLALCSLLSSCGEEDSSSEVPSTSSAEDTQMNEALMIAAQKGSVDAVKELLSQGAKVNAQNNNGCTALHWAARNGHTEVVLALLEAGADASLKDKNGETPLG